LFAPALVRYLRIEVNRNRAAARRTLVELTANLSNKSLDRI
jgi:hypothetical protein